MKKISWCVPRQPASIMSPLSVGFERPARAYYRMTRRPFSLHNGLDLLDIDHRGVARRGHRQRAVGRAIVDRRLGTLAFQEAVSEARGEAVAAADAVVDLQISLTILPQFQDFLSHQMQHTRVASQLNFDLPAQNYSFTMRWWHDRLIAPIQFLDGRIETIRDNCLQKNLDAIGELYPEKICPADEI